MIVPEGTFWIGSDHPFDLLECYIDLRAALDLSVVPDVCWLSITADSRYRLWINGFFVQRGPERSWPWSMAVDRIDITRHLRAGRNAVAVQVYSPGYSHFAHVHRAAAGAILWVEGGGQVLLRSDTGWRVRRNPEWAAEVPRVSIYGTGVERRTMDLATDWQVSEPAGWAAARVVQGPAGPIWSGLRARRTAPLTEVRKALDSPWQTRLGPAVAESDPHRALRQVFDTSTIAALGPEVPARSSAVWIFDLGHSQTCLGWADVEAMGGEVLLVSYAEKLRDGALLLSDPATYCRMRPTDRFDLRTGPQRLEGFTMRGARYLVFCLQTGDRPVPTPLFGVAIQSAALPARDLPDYGDATLNAVAAICRTTLATCLQDGFVDSIWRESSQWLGDVVAQAFGLAALTDDARPLRMAIDLAAEGAAGDGILPSVLPGDVPAYVVTDYNFSWIEALEMYLHHPGAEAAAEVVLGHWPVLCRMLVRFGADLGADGVIRHQAGRRLFLDWSAVDRGEPNLTYALRHLNGLQTAARLADRLGQREPWAHQAKALAKSVTETFRSGAGWVECPGGKPASQLALALLILTETVTSSEAGPLADRIVAASLDRDVGLIVASPFMHHYVFQALWHLGRTGEIAEIIAHRWGAWAKAGEPTTWENWAIDFPDGSACHGFSAHPLGWLERLRAAGGLSRR